MIIPFFKQHKTPIRYINSTLLLYAVTMLTSVITYRYIGPEFLGIWATFTTFSTLATFLRLGIVNGMNRELPYYLGKGESQIAYSYAETTLSYTLFSIVLLTIIGFVTILLWDFKQYGDLSSSYTFAAVVFFLSITVEPYKTYVSGTFRTNNSFDQLSRIQVISSLFKVPTLFLVVRYGFSGFLVREASIVVLDVSLLHWKRPLKTIKPIFKWDVFTKLFQVGFNIFLVSYLSAFVDTFPRLFILEKGTINEMGLFSPVLMLLSIVYLIPGTVSNYLYPKFSFAYGSGVPPTYFWKRIKLLLIIATVIGLVVSVVAYLLIDYVIPFFPKYEASLPYIKLMCFGLVFVSYKVCSVVFVIFKSYFWMWITPVVNAAFLLLSLFLGSIFFEDTLTIAVISIISSNCFMLIFMVFAVYSLTHKKVYKE